MNKSVEVQSTNTKRTYDSEFSKDKLLVKRRKIQTYEDFEELFEDWNIPAKNLFTPGGWTSLQSNSKINQWLDLVCGRWASTHYLLSSKDSVERLYLIVFDIIKDCLLFQSNDVLSIGEVSFGTMHNEEDLELATLNGIHNFKNTHTLVDSTVAHPNMLNLKNTADVVNLYDEINKYLKGMSNNSYAEFVISERSNVRGTSHPRLVVKVIPTLFGQSGVYQLCAELATRYTAKGSKGTNVHGVLTDSKEFQFFKATTTKNGYEIHLSEKYTFRGDTDLQVDAFVVIGYLFDILGIDEGIDMAASYERTLQKEQSLKNAMIGRAIKHRGFA